MNAYSYTPSSHWRKGADLLMPGLFTGNVTFLFADIEGSAGLWESHPEAMNGAQAQCDLLLRTAVEINGGMLFIAGADLFCAAFDSAFDAARAALAAQHAFHGEEWQEGAGRLRVRMTLHSSTAYVSEGDYVGEGLSRVTHILDAGHGGQILLTPATRKQLGDRHLAGAEVWDLGTHRLKDMVRPAHLYQLVPYDLPSQFPPLRTVDLRPNNLPAYFTSFVGRDGIVEAIANRLRQPEVRLLTLSGPEGIGKTRLAVQAAAYLLEEFKQGAFFVSLSSLQEPPLLGAMIAQALGVREDGSEPLEGCLQSALRKKQMLLILDDFERATGAASLLGKLLEVAPQLKIIVTHPTALGLTGERAFPVPPLALPESGALPAPEILAHDESVALFLERLQRLHPTFALTRENAQGVAALVTQLRGLPLAIELVAGFAEHALETDFSFLEIEPPDSHDLGWLSPRYGEMLTALICRSCDLLDRVEQEILVRSSLFVSSFTLEAARAVIGGNGFGEEEQLLPDTRFVGSDLLLDTLETLVEKGFLHHVIQRPEAPLRFILPDAVRRHTHERLVLRPDREKLQHRYINYYLELAESALPPSGEAQEGAWIEQVEMEYDHLRATLTWAQGKGDAERALRLVAALWRFWYVRGYLSEGDHWVEMALTQSDAADNNGASTSTARANVLLGSSLLRGSLGDMEQARARYEESLAIWQRLGNLTNVAWMLANLGIVALAHEEYRQAGELFKDSLRLFRAQEEERGIAFVVSRLAEVALMCGEYDRAASLYQESQQAFERLDDKGNLARALAGRGEVALALGQVEEAQHLYEQSLGLYQSSGSRWGLALSLRNLGDVTYCLGNYERARIVYNESLTLF
ncbi:MAG: tetratricopeptide repeat protein, partial [Ardenticatenales bacterium]|nr:tetratricopeptide repeat protein [Ardenticatenales bacterium]